MSGGEDNSPREHEWDLRLSQYQVLASSRQSADATLWQTPVIAFTGQAFLLTIVFNDECDLAARIVAGLLDLIVSLASIHLLWKHRYLEERAAKVLEGMERGFRRHYRVSRLLHRKPHYLARNRLYLRAIKLSAVNVWCWSLLIVGVAGFYPVVELIVCAVRKSAMAIH